MDERMFDEVTDDDDGPRVVNQAAVFDFTVLVCPKCGWRIVMTRDGWRCLSCSGMLQGG